MSKRLYYIDWLRVGAVLLLFPFHTWRVFNPNDPFYVKSPYVSAAWINGLMSFLDVWHMPLLFLLAGASTYFALRKRKAWQYVNERLLRLGIPFLFGLFVVIPPQTWTGARFNSGYTESFWHYLTSGDFLRFNIQGGGDYYGGFGVGQLWFIFYLFWIAIIALPLLLWWRSERGSRAAARVSRVFAHPAGWLLAAVLLWMFEGMPSPIEGKSFFLYLLIFVLGYVTMADERFMETAGRYRWLALGIGSAISIFRISTEAARDALQDPSWALTGHNVLGMLGLWLVMLGFLGVGKRYLDRSSSALTYLAEASYPLYILHQTVIVLLAFYIIEMPGPWFVQWVLLLIAAVAVTFGLYELVRRVGILRYCFGMRPKRRLEAGPVAAPSASA